MCWMMFMTRRAAAKAVDGGGSVGRAEAVVDVDHRDTPLPQLLSIPNSAASPPKLAP